uniref:Uncharacterized protein n=1 Tax=Rhizophora mucronata TaxID=61149 RepID=A0A2P2JJQ0_RHIMU
MKNFESELALR